MRVAVTGAGGRIGRHVVADLLAHDHEVMAVDRIAASGELAVNGATWVQADVRDPEAIARFLDGARAEAVIHLAAIPSPRFGTQFEVFATNTQATFAVLEAAGMAGVPRVAIASSTSVTGLPFASPPVSPLYVPVDEGHPNIGNDQYALSKETDEATARTMHRRHGYQVVALRIPTPQPWRSSSRSRLMWLRTPPVSPANCGPTSMSAMALERSAWRSNATSRAAASST